MQVTVRCYPKEDEAFALSVTARVGRIAAGNPRTLAEALSLMVPGLRAAYPSLRIVVQEPIASDGSGKMVVYAYRDGHALRVPRRAPGAAPARTRLASGLEQAARLVVLAERAIESSYHLAAELEAARVTNLSIRTAA